MIALVMKISILNVGFLRTEGRC